MFVFLPAARIKAIELRKGAHWHLQIWQTERGSLAPADLANGFWLIKSSLNTILQKPGQPIEGHVLQ